MNLPSTLTRLSLLVPFILVIALNITGCSSGESANLQALETTGPPAQPTPPTTPAVPPDNDPPALLPRGEVVPALEPPVQEGLRTFGFDQQPAFSEQTRAPGMSTDIPLTIETIAGIKQPWGMTFLSSSELLVTSKTGELHYVQLAESGGIAMVRTVDGLPAVPYSKSLPNHIAVSGQGGLLDVSAGKNFKHDRYVYFTFAETGDVNHYGHPASMGTSVARARLSEGNDHLSEWTILLRQAPLPDTSLHFGSRLEWDPSGYLYVTTGDRDQTRAEGDVQNLENLLGKVLRIDSEGMPPISNPFASGGGRTEIWSYGHRNMQGAAIDPYSGALWTTEHGPSGGDELNKPQAGLNYGWPLIGYGAGYRHPGMTWLQGVEQPIYYWDPSIAPSGMTFYYGTMFPEWNGQILIAALSGGLVRLMLLDDKVVGEQIHFKNELGRTRDVEVGPDGAIYLLRETDGGSLVRIRRGGN